VSNNPPRQKPDFIPPKTKKYNAQNVKIALPEDTPGKIFHDCIDEVLNYQDNLAICPYDVLQKAISIIDSGYRVIGLVDVGGEGIIIKVVDELQNLRALKIALPHSQAIGQRRVNYWKKLNPLGNRVDDVNSFKERFKQGSLLQDRLNKSIIRDKFPLLHIPAIHKVTKFPWLYADMEWIESVNIIEFLRARKSFNFSLEMFVKLLNCIEYVHEEGIVHRDLKSENIMIWHNDAIVILDWTLSKDMRVDRNLTVNMVAGTHFSPKIAQKGFSDFTIADEICSLGFVLAEFYFFRPVQRCFTLDELSRSRPIELDKKYARYREEIAKKIKNPIKDIFLKATHPEEKSRFELVVDFRKALEKSIKHTTMSMPVFSPNVIDEIHAKTILADIDEAVTIIENKDQYRITDFTYKDIEGTLAEFGKNICANCKYNDKCQDKLCLKIDKRVGRLIVHLKKEGFL